MESNVTNKNMLLMLGLHYIVSNYVTINGSAQRKSRKNIKTSVEGIIKHVKTLSSMSFRSTSGDAERQPPDAVILPGQCNSVLTT